MISLLSSRYTKEDYRSLYNLLYGTTNCTNKGKHCDSCVYHRACKDVDKLLEYLYEKTRLIYF